jgi:hypothetical protein
VARIGEAERADGDEHDGAAGGDDGLDRPARVDDGGGERAGEGEQGEDERDTLGHAAMMTAGAAGSARAGAAAQRGPTCSVRLAASSVAPSDSVSTTRAG